MASELIHSSGFVDMRRIATNTAQMYIGAVRQNYCLSYLDIGDSLAKFSGKTSARMKPMHSLPVDAPAIVPPLCFVISEAS